MVAVQARTETKSPFHIISGYRSPKTNSMLRAEGGEATGVAKKSMHLEGKAIDLRIPGLSSEYLGKLFKWLAQGGVGIYTDAEFTHLDTGRVRSWRG